MNKQAQISIFIIIGLVGLGIFFLITVANNTSSDKPADLPFERSALNAFITGCLQMSAEEAVFLVGKQGGYTSPGTFLASKNFEIAYLYDKGTNNVPTKEAVAEDIGKTIDQNILTCLDNFKEFERQGWKVTFEQPETTVSLNERDISFNQKFLISIEKDSAITFQRFSYSLPVRLGYMLAVADEIVAFHQEYPEWTDLTALSEHTVEITVFPYKQHLMYSLEDKASKIRLEPYLFNFALDFE